MAAKSSTLWFWSDWLGDQEVRRLTPEERGVWIDMLALAAAAQPFGYVCDGKGRALTDEEIARVTGCSPEAVAKLIAGIIDKGVASRDRTGRIYNRRMVRDAETRRKKAESGRKGGNATAEKHWGKPPLLQQALQHGWRAPIPSKKNIKPLLPVAARETQAVNNVEKPQGATDGSHEGKPCHAITRAEYDDLKQKQRTG